MEKRKRERETAAGREKLKGRMKGNASACLPSNRMEDLTPWGIKYSNVGASEMAAEYNYRANYKQYNENLSAHSGTFTGQGTCLAVKL